MAAVQYWVLNWTLQLRDPFLKRGHIHDMGGPTAGTQLYYEISQRHYDFLWLQTPAVSLC